MEGRPFEREYSKGELDLSEHELELTEPLTVTGSVSLVGEVARVVGQLKALAVRACDRCLKDVPIAVDEPFELYYEPNDSSNAASGAGTEHGGSGTGANETEIRGRDLEVSVYENDEIDLDHLVIEQLALNVPTRVLCSPDCRGLCDQCGTDLNIASCNCEAPIDPRWQALLDIKNRQSEEN